MPGLYTPCLGAKGIIQALQANCQVPQQLEASMAEEWKEGVRKGQQWKSSMGSSLGDKQQPGGADPSPRGGNS